MRARAAIALCAVAGLYGGVWGCNAVLGINEPQRAQDAGQQPLPDGASGSADAPSPDVQPPPPDASDEALDAPSIDAVDAVDADVVHEADGSSCGQLGEPCCGTIQCSAGTCCGATCVDMSQDPSHCGNCGKVCEIGCAASACLKPEKVGLGDDHSCAVMSDKTVRCWGLNTDGQLGDGSYINRNRPVPVLQSAGIPLQNATWVTSGSRHSCATLGTGKVVCWGRDDAGQLGDGSFVDTTMAVSVFGLTNVTDLDTGGFHTCAVSNSTLQCWGKNAYKTISTAAQSYFNTPTLVGVPEPAKVGLGYQHSCASDVSGNVWCLGYNFNGELGDNTQDDKYAPDKVQQCSPAGPLTSVSSLAAGARHMCAIKTDKSVWCWGDSTDGQAGNGTASQNLCAVPVSVLTSAEKIVAGTNHVCAIASNQDLYCWGDNSVGQMGDSSTNDVTTPKVVMSNVVEVGAGGGHTCAILADGTMKCWGENLHGQLGQGVDSQKALPGDVKW